MIPSLSESVRRFLGWSERSPVRAVHAVAGGMHAGAGAMVLAYNSILQKGFAAPTAPKILLAGLGYLLAAVAAAYSLRHRSLKTRVVPYLSDPTDERLERLFLFPLHQSLNSLLCWFLAIPVLGFVTVWVNGALHPVRFPHFCLSILFAGLISSAYSAIFHTGLVCRLAKAHPSKIRVPAGLTRLARITPWMALAIPITVCVVFVSFDRPEAMDPVYYEKLGRFFAFLMALSGYGWVFCDLTYRRLRGGWRKLV